MDVLLYIFSIVVPIFIWIGIYKYRNKKRIIKECCELGLVLIWQTKRMITTPNYFGSITMEKPGVSKSVSLTEESIYSFSFDYYLNKCLESCEEFLKFCFLNKKYLIKYFTLYEETNDVCVDLYDKRCLNKYS